MMKRLFLAMAMMMAVASVSAQEVVAEYEKLFKEGIEAFDDRDYKGALAKFKRVVNMPATSQSLRVQANEFIKTCQTHLGNETPKPKKTTVEKKTAQPVVKKEIVHTLSLSPLNLQLPATGGTKEITVSSSAEWTVKIKPDWCKVMEMTDNYIKLWCDENANLEAREGEFVISADNGKLIESVHLFQEKGMNRSGQVYFRTIPGNAMIEIPDCGLYGISSRAYKIPAGDHKVRVMKDGYEPLDTTVTVTPSQDGKAAMVDLSLEPVFGILTPEIVMEDTGKSLPEPVFKINKRIVDVSTPAEGLSFDEEGGVVYGVLYKGGRIPLLPGAYEVNVSAEGYEPFNTYVTVEKGQMSSLQCELKYVSGFLTVVDDGNAEGAAVVADEKFTCNVGEKLRLPVGDYLIEVKKDGYMLDDGIIEANIAAGEEVMHKARMTRMVNCLVSTEQTGETVYVNGDKAPFKEPMHTIPLAEGKSYIIEVAKDGYWTYRDSIFVSPSDTLIDLQGLDLKEVHKLHIAYDEPNVKVSLYAKGDSVRRDYAGIIPEKGKDIELDVPYGKYKLKMTRIYEPIKGRKTAYKGNVNFTEKKDRFNIQTWSRSNFLVLGGDYNFMSSFAPADSYPVSGSAFFGQFKLWNGLSTSIVKATAFNTAAYDFPYEDDTKAQPDWTFGASFLLLNYDFRIGGAFCQYGDAAVLLSYAWNPSLTFAVPVNHFSGQEAFAGIELSSRIKVFNVNLKLGVQYMDGKFNCFNVQDDRYVKTKDSFTYMPFSRVAFVGSVGFSLGGRDAKGRNILRVW